MNHIVPATCRPGRLWRLAAAISVTIGPVPFLIPQAAARVDARAVRASAREDAVALAIRDQARGWLKRFYAQRGFRPIWADGGRIAGAVGDDLIGYLRTADRDGLNPSSYRPDSLAATVAKAKDGEAAATARAELALSDAFVRYVRDQRRPRETGTIWADKTLRPKRPDKETVLRAAAFPKSIAGYVDDMGWMSPLYVRLRKVVGRSQGLSGDEIARLRRNLDRARILPSPSTRHIVVDASSGRLWYYEAGRQVGTMRVVVGTHETQTPMLAGTLQWAIVNPYWNVPTYLAKKNIAPKVLGGRPLSSFRMDVLSDWTANAHVVPASSVDWTAVASGKEEIRLRERPGPANSMGKVKFLFPNDEGIYLHDTPVRDLLKADDRHFSNGCIRLENAATLARWLLQKPLPSLGKTPEHAVPLPVQVPVYLTYLTVDDAKAGLAFRPDVYDRDG